MSDWDSDEVVWLEFDKLEHETPGAKLFLIDKEKVWIPRSVIVDHDEALVGVKRWFAEKENLV